MAATEVISLGSSPLPGATLPAESPTRTHSVENPPSDTLPSPSTYIRYLRKAQSDVVAPPVRQGRTPVPPGRMGFCTASALHKEKVLEQSTLQALNLQRFASTETTLPSGSEDGLEKPKTTRKRAIKKNDTPKLKLDKKPTVRKPRKKKDQVADEAEMTMPAKEHTPLGDLQIFEYKPDTGKGGNKAVPKPNPVESRKIRDEPKHKVDEGLQVEVEVPTVVRAVEVPTVVRAKEHTPLDDLQVFEYKPNAEEGGDEPALKPAKDHTPLGDLQVFEYKPNAEEGGSESVAKPKTRKPRQKKSEPQLKPAQAEDQADAVVRAKEVTPLWNLAVSEYAPDAQKNGDEVAAKPKPRKPRAKKSQAASKPDGEPQEDQAVIRDMQGADHAEPNVEPAALPAVVAKIRKPRQPKKDKAMTEAQAELKAKVTKPRTNAKAGKKVQEETVQTGTDVVDLPITIDHTLSEVPTTSNTDIVLQVPEDLALAPALKRRRSWTPPRTTEPSRDEDSSNDASSLQEDETMLAAPTTFLNLKGSFGYNEQNVRDEGAGALAKPDEPVLKRRRIEVTKVPKVPKKKASPEKKAPKPKAPKAPPKAVRTVTGIALANFQQQDMGTNQLAVPGDLQPLDTETAQAVNVDAGTAAIKSAIKRKRSVSPTKRSSLDGPGSTKTKKSTKKVTVAVPQKLLSPGAAQKRLEKQDILFGTSSQLAREDSPTFLRELQQAIKASESQAMEEAPDEVLPAMRRKSLSSLRATRKLWSVGSRGAEMEFLEAEPPLPERRSVMMAEASMPPMTEIPLSIPAMGSMSAEAVNAESVSAATVSNIAQQANSQHIDLISSDAFQDIDTIIGLPQQPAVYATLISSPPSAQANTRPNVLQDLSTNKKLNLVANNLLLDDNKPPPSSQKGSDRARSHSPKKTAVFDTVQPTTAHTTDPITRKSPRRASTAPIILTSSPYHDIDDIEDSEPELTSSPPRRRSPPRLRATLELSPRSARKRQRTASRSPSPSPRPRNSPSAKSPKVATKSKATASKPAKSKRAPPKPKPTKPTTEEEAAHNLLLFKAITAAVTSAPPTTDLKKPSWYEKMLLYDPIVLEDLAGWLNGGVLRGYMVGVGEQEGVLDGEGEEEAELIKPALLQKWCEENSICCLWRNGLRGGVKAKY